jgi:hypothetical protein
LAVTSGGSAKIVEDGSTRSRFRLATPRAAPAQLRRLVENPALGRRIAHAGGTVIDGCRFPVRVDRIEAALNEAARDSAVWP